MAKPNIYDLGVEVHVTGVFTDPNNGDAVVDPDTVNFSFRDPSGNLTTYVYGTDAQLVRDSAGNYSVDIDADEAGTWRYRWYSTGTGKTAEEGTFIVRTLLTQ